MPRWPSGGQVEEDVEFQYIRRASIFITSNNAVPFYRSNEIAVTDMQVPAHDYNQSWCLVTSPSHKEPCPCQKSRTLTPSCSICFVPMRIQSRLICQIISSKLWLDKRSALASVVLPERQPSNLIRFSFAPFRQHDHHGCNGC